ncbi:MAG: TlpA family protein disulfide reductase, partial [Bacteroidetes bacterium]
KLGELKDYFNSLPYKPVLYYNAELYSYSKEVLPIRNKEIVTGDDLGAAVAAINNTFKNAAKDYLLSNLMMYAYGKRIPIPREIHAKYNKECHDADYKRIVANERIKQQQLAKIPHYKWYLAKANSDKNIRVEELLKVYKGKYVLLDFWATWCGPCIADMPYLKQFTKDYLSRDVMVIGISADKNKQMWEKFMLSYNLNPQINYNIKRSSANILFRGIAVETIPRYMLLNTSGKLVYDSLPSPSSLAFRNIIDSIIERN